MMDYREKEPMTLNHVQNLFLNSFQKKDIHNTSHFIQRQYVDKFMSSRLIRQLLAQFIKKKNWFMQKQAGQSFLSRKPSVHYCVVYINGV